MPPKQAKSAKGGGEERVTQEPSEQKKRSEEEEGGGEETKKKKKKKKKKKETKGRRQRRKKKKTIEEEIKGKRAIEGSAQGTQAKTVCKKEAERKREEKEREESRVLPTSARVYVCECLCVREKESEWVKRQRMLHITLSQSLGNSKSEGREGKTVWWTALQSTGGALVSKSARPLLRAGDRERKEVRQNRRTELRYLNVSHKRDKENYNSKAQHKNRAPPQSNPHTLPHRHTQVVFLDNAAAGAVFLAAGLYNSLFLTSVGCTALLAATLLASALHLKPGASHATMAVHTGPRSARHWGSSGGLQGATLCAAAGCRACFEPHREARQKTHSDDAGLHSTSQGRERKVGPAHAQPPGRMGNIRHRAECGATK